jgi:hypothetical protein
MTITLIDVFAEDPTMRKREAFESRLMSMIAELRRTRPPARRAQLRADSESLLNDWLDLTGQQASKEETEQRIAYAVQARSYKTEKWEPAPTHDADGAPL